MKLAEIKKIGIPLGFKVTEASDSQVKKFKTTIASQDSLRKLLPDINEEENPDILSIAFDSSVANLVNLNDHGILTESAKLLAPTFKFKPINIEHEKSWVVGCVLNQGYSRFDTGEEMDDVDDDEKEPFNICLGGVLWRNVDGWFTDIIEDSADKFSYIYNNYSASWEVGYDEFYIAVGSKKLADAKIITDDEEIEKMMEHLKTQGGKGFLPDGTPIYTIIAGKPVGFGIGMTTNPAGNVKGIVTANKSKFSQEQMEFIKELVKANTFNPEELEKNILEKTSQIISIANKNTVIKKRMKIKDISDLTEDTLKEVTASEIRSLLQDELAKKNKEFQEKEVAAANEIESLKNEVATAKEKQEELEKNFLEASNKLSELKNKEDERAKKEISANRIKEVEKLFSFEGQDALKKFVFDRVQSLDSDEAFASYKAELELTIPHLKVKEGQSGKTTEDALASAKAQGSTIPNIGGTGTLSLKERAKQAFNTKKD